MRPPNFFATFLLRHSHSTQNKETENATTAYKASTEKCYHCRQSKHRKRHHCRRNDPRIVQDNPGALMLKGGLQAIEIAGSKEINLLFCKDTVAAIQVRRTNDDMRHITIGKRVHVLNEYPLVGEMLENLCQ